jgi:hypothetical protein
MFVESCMPANSSEPGYEDYHTRNSSREQTVLNTTTRRYLGNIEDAPKGSTGKPSPHGLLNAVWFCGLVPAGTW